jgi:hypothetical protein
MTVEFEQVLVSGDDVTSVTTEGAGQHGVILCISTVNRESIKVNRLHFDRS